MLLLTSCNFAPKAPSPNEISELSYRLQTRYQIEGTAMLPSFPDRAIAIVDEGFYQDAAPKRGDVIVLQHPSRPDVVLIKRIIGLPSEQVKIEDGQVYINEELLEELNIVESTNYEGAWQIGNGEYFVLGDNRNNSSDSHSWGPLADELIIGKVTAVCATDSPENCATVENIVYDRESKSD